MCSWSVIAAWLEGVWLECSLGCGCGCMACGWIVVGVSLDRRGWSENSLGSGWIGVAGGCAAVFGSLNLP